MDTQTDPSHCGGCGDECSGNRVCVNGNCEDWEIAPDCNACPCDACEGDLDQCCEWALLGAVVCTEAGSCP